MSTQTDFAFNIGGADEHPLLELIDHPRAEHAFQIERGTRFSDDRSMRSSVRMLREIQRYPEIWDDLERETTDATTYERRKTGKAHVVGRPRMDGHWGLIGCAWLLQRESDVQVFYDNIQDTNIWAEAGFDERIPCYATTVDRLAELEHFTLGFNHAAAKLWRTAMRANPNIGRHVWIDATAYESHALLHHDCEDKAACAANGGKGAPAMIERETMKAVENDRHERHKNADPDADRDDAEEPTSDEALLAADWQLGDIDEIVLEQLEEEAEKAQHPKYARRRRESEPSEQREHFIAWGKSKYKHRYVCRDADAGARTYTAPNGKKIRSWVGGLKLAATDITTGARIAHLYVPANEAEHEHYPELLERIKAILGRYPENVLLDRGYNVFAVHRLNAMLGIGQVIPWRKRGGLTDRHQDRLDGLIDEYGVPICQHCGSPGTTLGQGNGYEIKHGEGYLRFRCANPHTTECRISRQSVRWRDAPRHVQALSHERELYWELRLHAKEQERVHRQARTRYRDAGNNVDTRQKILGTGVLEARGAIAGFLEIFRVCLRFGWFGNYANARAVVERRLEGGARGLKIFRRLRRMNRLHLPSGPKAEALGLVFPGVLPNGWVPIRQRRTEAKNGRPGRMKGKAKAPPDVLAADPF